VLSVPKRARGVARRARSLVVLSSDAISADAGYRSLVGEAFVQYFLALFDRDCQRGAVGDALLATETAPEPIEQHDEAYEIL
jgi:hypothetical protein